MHARSSLPFGLAPLIACLGLLALWEGAARVLGLSGLPPAYDALRELPLILSDAEALLNIAASLRRMLLGFVLALLLAVPAGRWWGGSGSCAACWTPVL